MRSLALALLVSSVWAGTQPETREPSSLDLERRVVALISQPRFQSATWGIAVHSLETGDVLFETNASRLLHPASAAKLFTVALALEQLGPDSTIRTPIRSATRADPSGRLNGDLVIAGRGDFSWAARFRGGDSTRSLEPVIQAIEQAGIRHVRGDLVGDTRFFQGPRPGTGWSWDDLQYYYAAETSALTCDDNVVDLQLTPGPAAGSPCKLIARPDPLLIDFRNLARTTPPGGARGIQVWRPLDANDVWITGHLPLQSTGWVDSVSVHNPAEWFLARLRSELAAKGIRIDGQCRALEAVNPLLAGAAEPAPASPLLDLAVVESPTLADLVTRTLKHSHNLYAQMLWLQVGARSPGEPTATSDTTEHRAQRALAAWLDHTRLNPADVRLPEGSGLAASARLTPRAIAQLLRWMTTRPSGPVFRAALPVAGVDGTLAHRMKGTPAEGRVQAKTGTLSGVHSLCGYATSRSGADVVFSFLLNGYFPADPAEARADLDALAVIIAEWTDPNRTAVSSVPPRHPN